MHFLSLSRLDLSVIIDIKIYDPPKRFFNKKILQIKTNKSKFYTVFEVKKQKIELNSLRNLRLT